MIKKKLSHLVIILISISIFASFAILENKLTGFVITENCTTTGGIANGTFVNSIYPLNNSVILPSELKNYTSETNYYGTPVIETCDYGESGIVISPCYLELIKAVYYIYPNGTKNEIQHISVNASETNQGTKIYTSESVCKTTNCTEGNYEIETYILYPCGNRERELTTITSFTLNSSTQITLKKFNYSSITPQDNQVIPVNNINIEIIPSSPYYVNKVEIFLFNSLGEIIKTMNSTLKQSIYSLAITNLSNGEYSFYATITDNTNQKINLTRRNIEVQIGAIVNETPSPTTTLSFGPETNEDNSITNKSIITIALLPPAQPETIIPNITFNLYKEGFGIINPQQVNLSYSNISFDSLEDGVYFFNATIQTSDGEISTPTRKVIIDTLLPTLEVISPINKKYNSTSSISIELLTQDENGIEKQWFYDGIKDTTITSKTSRTITPGNYTWIFYAKDIAGNIASETVKFSILESVVQKTTPSSNKKIAYIIIIIAIILMIIILAYYLLKNKKSPGEPSQQTQFNKPIPPQNPMMSRPMQMQQRSFTPQQTPFTPRSNPQFRPTNLPPQRSTRNV